MEYYTAENELPLLTAPWRSLRIPVRDERHQMWKSLHSASLFIGSSRSAKGSSGVRSHNSDNLWVGVGECLESSMGASGFWSVCPLILVGTFIGTFSLPTVTALFTSDLCAFPCKCYILIFEILLTQQNI